MRNLAGKYLLRGLVRYKRFSSLPSFVKLFPRQTYKALSDLMRRGYLDLAYEIAKDYTPKPHEKDLVERIVSMVQIRKNRLAVERIAKPRITEVKVLFAVHNSLPYDKAGYALRTHLIAKTLQHFKTPLHVVTRPGYPWDLQKHRSLQERPQTDTIEGVHYTRIPDSDKHFKRGADRHYIGHYAEALVSMAKQTGATIIHAHSNYLNGLAAAEAANRLKLPFVYEVRGFWHKTRATLDENYRSRGMFEYESMMEKTAVNAADAVVTISEPLRKLLIEWGVSPEKIHVIPNAVDTAQFTPKPPSARLTSKYNLQGKTVVGFIGSLTGYEGLKELITAVDALIDEGLEIALMIVGEGREEKNLRALARSKQIIFTGRVPFDEVAEYYTLFDICPFPRNDVEICRYVPPLKPLEAMAMEKAVIVSDLPPLREIIEEGKNGMICKADNAQSLKNQIANLYNNKQTVKTLGKEARQWVTENRSLHSMAEKYKKLYASLGEQ